MTENGDYALLVVESCLLLVVTGPLTVIAYLASQSGIIAALVLLASTGVFLAIIDWMDEDLGWKYSEGRS